MTSRSVIGLAIVIFVGLCSACRFSGELLIPPSAVPLPVVPVWTWASGQDRGPYTFSYGTKGIADPGNYPRGRSAGAMWAPSNGNIYLFGGNFGFGDLNDLWQYSPRTQLWTWINGSSARFDAGSYGTLGVAAASNSPGARGAAGTWVGKDQKLYLYGGYTAITSDFGDLWSFDTSTNDWTWISGNNTGGPAAVYGTQGVPAVGNFPGVRFYPYTWTDTTGNLWFFGGTDTARNRSDLWRFNPLTLEWTWMQGSMGQDAVGVYGSVGAAPGARSNGCSLTDSQGNFFLYGGTGHTDSSSTGFLNDLWQYHPASGQWTLKNGDTTLNQPPTYGAAKGVASVLNSPGGRSGSLCWFDGQNRLWVFGGQNGSTAADILGDLWLYDFQTNLWTFESGSQVNALGGIYGTLGVANALNIPGARVVPAYAVDSARKIWLFGGYAYDAATTLGNLADLWTGQQ